MEPLTFLVVLLFGFGGGFTYKAELVKAKEAGKAEVAIEQSK